MSASTRPSSHIPNLDGIRALAVTIVVLAHLGFGGLVPGGFGVSVFFFLSGYLITTLLLREYRDTGTVSLKRFYLRRTLRIVPPMYLTYALALALVLVGLNPSTLDTGPMLLQLAYLQNYIQLLMPAQEWNIPSHTDILWSLAVEEHFYLVYPLLLLVLLRRVPLRTGILVLCLGAALELAWRAVLVQHFGAPPRRIYSLTDTRFDSLLYGCVLAIAHYASPALATARVGLRGVVVMALSVLALISTFVLRDPFFRDTFRFTVQGIALMPLFHYAIRVPEFAPFRVLETAPMRWLGTRSYTVYLCNELLTAVVDNAWPGGLVFERHLVAIVLTVGYAELMYRFVERPLGRMRTALHGPEPVTPAVEPAPTPASPRPADDAEPAPASATAAHRGAHLPTEPHAAARPRRTEVNAPAA
jgi:peptidoglycan/LPS O-acetylase OafA/YrhL